MLGLCGWEAKLSLEERSPWNQHGVIWPKQEALICHSEASKGEHAPVTSNGTFNPCLVWISSLELHASNVTDGGSRQVSSLG